MAKSKTKRKVGRPSKYDRIKKLLPEIRLLYEKGLIDKQVSKILQINESTLNDYKNKHPEFSKSLKDSKAEADAHVRRALYERATGYQWEEEKDCKLPNGKHGKKIVKHFMPPDVTACVFWLKNRDPDFKPDQNENFNKIMEFFTGTTIEPRKD